MGKRGNVKQKPFRQIQAYSRIFPHIQTYPDIVRYIQAYSGIIQAYSEYTQAYPELWYIQNPVIFKTRDIFRTLLYLKLWHIRNQGHIQNPGLFRTLGFSEPGTYSEPCQTSTMERFEKQLTGTITFASYSYFRNISFRRLLVHEINIIF